MGATLAPVRTEPLPILEEARCGSAWGRSGRFGDGGDWWAWARPALGEQSAPRGRRGTLTVPVIARRARDGLLRAPPEHEDSAEEPDDDEQDNQIHNHVHHGIPSLSTPSLTRR